MYFSSAQVGSTFFPAMRHTLFSPKQLFGEMPQATGYRNSFILLAIILLAPLLPMMIEALLITSAEVLGLLLTPIGLLVVGLLTLFSVVATWLWVKI